MCTKLDKQTLVKAKYSLSVHEPKGFNVLLATVTKKTKTLYMLSELSRALRVSLGRLLIKTENMEITVDLPCGEKPIN